MSLSQSRRGQDTAPTTTARAGYRRGRPRALAGYSNSHRHQAGPHIAWPSRSSHNTAWGRHLNYAANTHHPLCVVTGSVDIEKIELDFLTCYSNKNASRPRTSIAKAVCECRQPNIVVTFNLIKSLWIPLDAKPSDFPYRTRESKL
ncbi:Uncharacterised protein [Mycobacteroides abscessus subsp. abscessus]|nr:Uncharacterised protein [Mycobacteroides abscessus subsp. abscessus]SKS88407.1 Uncharacterised protein [Mycobacteroides abscessus subsp. abscessus]